MGAPLWLPPRRPRNLAVEIHDPEGELERLQRELVGELARAVGVGARAAALQGPPDGRTGARQGAPARGPAGTLRRSRRPPPCASSRESVTLYRSCLEPRGARYEALATRPLGASVLTGARPASPRRPVREPARPRPFRGRQPPSYARPKPPSEPRPAPQCADSESSPCARPKRMRPAIDPPDTGRQGCSCKGCCAPAQLESRRSLRRRSRSRPGLCLRAGSREGGRSPGEHPARVVAGRLLAGRLHRMPARAALEAERGTGDASACPPTSCRRTSSPSPRTGRSSSSRTSTAAPTGTRRSRA